MKRHREQANLTQHELAAKVVQPGGAGVGIDHSYVSKAENGDQIPEWIAQEFARILGVSTRVLFRRAKVKKYYVAKEAK